jgi:quinol monooxygenase YgiN
MDEIRITATLRIFDGMLEEFKEHCNALVKMIREKEHGTTKVYEFYLDDTDPTICFAHEIYANADGFAKHVEHMASAGMPYEHLFSIEQFDICGQLPSELADGMREYAKAGNIQHRNFNRMCATI